MLSIGCIKSDHKQFVWWIERYSSYGFCKGAALGTHPECIWLQGTVCFREQNADLFSRLPLSVQPKEVPIPKELVLLLESLALWLRPISKTGQIMTQCYLKYVSLFSRVGLDQSQPFYYWRLELRSKITVCYKFSPK